MRTRHHVIVRTCPQHHRTNCARKEAQEGRLTLPVEQIAACDGPQVQFGRCFEEQVRGGRECLAEAIVRACRENWWVTQGGRREIGLVNRRVETRRIAGGDGLLAKVALKPGKAAVGIVSAGYDPSSGRITLSLADGRTLLLTAGQHIEEAEEW